VEVFLLTPTIVPSVPAQVRAADLGGVTVRNTSNLFTPDTRICMLAYAHAKRGKTTFAATMDGFTKKYFGKPTLIIAVEAGEGGGTMSIQDFNVDYVCPANMEELNRIIAALATDTKYGGVVLDSATEYVNRFLKPYALKFPYTKGSAPATRLEGVPEQGDYQTMGERARMDFNKLINLTSHPDKNIRKHLLVTALEKEKTNRDGVLLSIQPDLPGAMAMAATAMFNTVGCIELRTTVEPDPANPKTPRRVTRRMLVTDATEENKKILGDRTKRIPTGSPLDFGQIYEKSWIPGFKGEA
jgi:AAA domain